MSKRAGYVDVDPKKNQLGELLMNAPAFICILKGKDHEFEMANALYYQLVGHRDIIGLPVRVALPETVSQGFINLLDNVLATGKPYTGNELPVMLQRQKDGPLEELFLNFVYQPIKEADNSYSGIFVHGVDVTDQVIARRKAEQNEDWYRTIFNSVNEGFCIVEIIFDEKHKPIDYRVLETNVMFEKHTGLVDAVGKTARELHLEEHWIEAYSNVAITGKAIRYSQGSDILGKWFDVYATRVGGKSSKIVAIIFKDITERKTIDEALKEQLRIIEAITNNATVCLFMIDTNGVVTYINPAAEQITGYTAKEAIGRPMHLLVHHSRPDGTPYPESECPLVQTYKDGEPNPTHEDTFFRKDGTSFPAQITGLPIQGETGVQGTVVEFQDITEAKHAEQELRQLITVTEQRNALIKINKTKDEFIGMASHQLRTPATAVKQYVGLLLSDFVGPLTPEQTQYLKIAYDSNERELNIIDDLLKTAQLSADNYHLNKQMHDIGSLIAECIEELKITLKEKNHKVIFNKPAEVVRVPLDRTEMKLAFTNLIENANKYSYPGTNIHVVLKPLAKQVKLSISDEGVGISQENHQRIFEKFTRVDNNLSDTVNGTGLGLFWVKQIVELHQGSIKLDSKLGKGSTFTILLPQ